MVATCCAKNHPHYVTGWKALAYPVALVITFAWVVITNALSADNNRIVSDLYPTFITPQGWAFSIWGVIYLWQAMLVVLSFLDRGNPWIVSGAMILPLNYICNGIWIFLFNPGILVWSALMMCGILLTLVVVYHSVGISYYREAWHRAWPTCSCPDHEQPEPLYMSAWTFLILQPAISIYLGWISVATIANISIVAVAYNPDIAPMTQVFWSCFMQGVAALLGLIFLRLRADVLFGAVISWALFAIADKQGADRVQYPEVGAVATTLACLVGAATVLTLLGIILSHIGLELRNGGASLGFRQYNEHAHLISHDQVISQPHSRSRRRHRSNY